LLGREEFIIKINTVGGKAIRNSRKIIKFRIKEAQQSCII
jgi:hypothetical protein